MGKKAVRYHKPRWVYGHKQCWVCAYILLAGIVLGGCGPRAFLIKPIPLKQGLKETEIERDEGAFIKDKIAVIDVDGLMFDKGKWGMLLGEENQVSLFVEKLDRACKDRNVKAVVLRLNSPGGTVAI